MFAFDTEHGSILDEQKTEFVASTQGSDVEDRSKFLFLCYSYKSTN